MSRDYNHDESDHITLSWHDDHARAVCTCGWEVRCSVGIIGVETQSHIEGYARDRTHEQRLQLIIDRAIAYVEDNPEGTGSLDAILAGEFDPARNKTQP